MTNPPIEVTLDALVGGEVQRSVTAFIPADGNFWNSVTLAMVPLGDIDADYLRITIPKPSFMV